MFKFKRLLEGGLADEGGGVNISKEYAKGGTVSYYREQINKVSNIIQNIDNNDYLLSVEPYNEHGRLFGIYFIAKSKNINTENVSSNYKNILKRNATKYLSKFQKKFFNKDEARTPYVPSGILADEFYNRKHYLDTIGIELSDEELDRIVNYFKDNNMKEYKLEEYIQNHVSYYRGVINQLRFGVENREDSIILAKYIAQDNYRFLKIILKQNFNEDYEYYSEILKSHDEQKPEYFASGGLFNDSYNRGRSWHLDRARHNKSEKYEVPINKRKKN